MIKDRKGLKRVNASTILKTIEKGEPVVYDLYIIEGNLDISKSDLTTERNEMISLTDRGNIIDQDLRSELEEDYVFAQKLKLVKSSIQITNSVIEDPIDFKYAKFEKEVFFGDCIFESDINFFGCNFNNISFHNSALMLSDFTFCLCFGELNFEMSILNAESSFRWCAFLGQSNFNKTKFKDVTDFTGAYLRDINFSEASFRDAHFFNASFNHITTFGHPNLTDKSAEFFGSANFKEARFCDDLIFNGVYFHDLANFNNSKFKGLSNFGTIIFKKEADFSDAKFENNADFSNSRFEDAVSFKGSKFNSNVSFRSVKFFKNAVFSKTTFLGDSSFDGDGKNYLAYIYINILSLVQPSAMTAKSIEQLRAIWDHRTMFEGPAYFSDSVFNETNFSKTQFKKLSTLPNAKFLKGFSFKNTIFKDPFSEELASRKSKKESELQGDKDEADRYYFREMTAKRKQKRFYFRYPEFLVFQWIFRYGVHPLQLLFSWGAIILAFGILYYNANYIKQFESLIECIKFSFAAATAPGYIGSIINSEDSKLPLIYQITAICETIIGTVLWACFIATFSRKFMR